ncbi:MAG: erythromycin esterase family protein [Ignavibacteria bacterium]|nr:erythromycin esterase family protein [Ignavibacteria bacterium]
MMTNKLILFFTILSALLFCAHASLSAQQHGNPLLPHIVPLESCLPKDTISTKEHEVLSALFNGARVIGLGEATHGTHEIFTMKHRLIKFLVQSKGFKLIGLEAGMPEVEVVNRYILSDEGSSSALLAVYQLGMWSVGNYEMLDLVQWLYHFNQQQTEKNKVRICGFDVQMTDSAVRTVTRFLRRVNPQYAATLLNTENCYQWLTANSTMTAQNIWTYQADSVKQHYISNADSVLYHFERYRKQYEKATSSKECAWAQRNAWLVSRAVRLFSSTKTRDSSMAENVSWLMKYFKQDKIILSAHNGHVWCENHTASNSDATMGWYLREKYAQEYFAVALTANTGTYSAVHEGVLRRNNTILLPSTTNHLENYLHRAAIPQGFINLRAIQPTDASFPWFSRLQAMRFIGSVVLPTQFGYTYLLKNFDAIVFIDSTIASNPLPDFSRMR